VKVEAKELNTAARAAALDPCRPGIRHPRPRRHPGRVLILPHRARTITVQFRPVTPPRHRRPILLTTGRPGPRAALAKPVREDLTGLIRAEIRAGMEARQIEVHISRICRTTARKSDGRCLGTASCDCCRAARAAGATNDPRRPIADKLKVCPSVPLESSSCSSGRSRVSGWWRRWCLIPSS